MMQRDFWNQLHFYLYKCGESVQTNGCCPGRAQFQVSTKPSPMASFTFPMMKKAFGS